MVNLEVLIKEKMEDTKKYKIESDEEFLYLCGLSARYLRSLFDSKEKKDRLVSIYTLNRNIKYVFNMLIKDTVLVAGKIPLDSKFNDILGKVLDYDSSKIDFKENNKFLCGLLGGDISVFYNKKSEKIEGN